MCSRYIISQDSAQIEQIISKIDKSNSMISKLKFGEIFPTDYVPVIIRKENHNIYTTSRWGFQTKDNNLIINARSETIFEKPMFKNLALNHRMLIPANGFYESKKKEKSKEKILFETSNRFFYFAGLGQPTNDGNINFVILTTMPTV